LAGLGKKFRKPVPVRAPLFEPTIRKNLSHGPDFKPA
jgi:hypothetical protein